MVSSTRDLVREDRSVPVPTPCARTGVRSGHRLCAYDEQETVVPGTGRPRRRTHWTTTRDDSVEGTRRQGRVGPQDPPHPRRGDSLLRDSGHPGNPEPPFNPLSQEWVAHPRQDSRGPRGTRSVPLRGWTEGRAEVEDVQCTDSECPSTDTLRPHGRPSRHKLCTRRTGHSGLPGRQTTPVLHPSPKSERGRGPLGRDPDVTSTSQDTGPRTESPRWDRDPWA